MQCPLSTAVFLHNSDSAKHNLCHSHLTWTQAVNYVSEICPVALWSDPLLGSLFSNHCREEKLGGSSSAQTSAQHSTNPVGQDHLSVERPHNMWNTHTLAHSRTYLLTHFSLIFSTAHALYTRTISKPRHTGNHPEIEERKLETPSQHPGWKHLQLWNRKISAEKSAANGKHIPLFLKTWYLSKCNLPVPAPDGTLCFISGRSDEQKVHRAQPPPRPSLWIPHPLLTFCYPFSCTSSCIQLCPETHLELWV